MENTNLKLNQQKEFEKMINKIYELENELLKQERLHNKDMERENNIKKGFIKEIDKLKKEKLEMIRENSKLNKRIDSYIKRDEDLKNNTVFKDFEKLTDEEKWDNYSQEDTYNDNGEYDAYFNALEEEM